jgi:S-adenosylmethionine hydrolase
MPPLITLTTDFGVSDIYVGVMKGVIFGICPDARVIDITHGIAPQNLMEASLSLEAAAPYFPSGTIHVVVVDPGVGSDRAAVIVRTASSTFVGPDNGVMTLPLLIQHPMEVITVTEAASPFLHHPISATFHGRDVFAPVAAHLANGVPLSSFGSPRANSDLVSLPVPDVKISRTNGLIELQAPILAADHFGNLVTALRRDTFGSHCASAGCTVPADSAIQVRIKSTIWTGISRTFASVAVGAPVAYWGSGGRLEVAVRNGNAANSMNAQAADLVCLQWRAGLEG